MTLDELGLIKEDLSNDISLTDIAMNRAYNKASMVAILNFENVVREHYSNLFDELLASEKNKLEVKYQKKIKDLEDEIYTLKNIPVDEDFKNLKKNFLQLQEELDYINEDNKELNRKLFKYENSFFSFLIQQ